MKTFLKLTLFLIITSMISACGGSDDAPTMEEMAPDEITLEGDYIGTWNSETDRDITYTDFGISARLEFGNPKKTRLRGEFFATTSFNSCCNSGDNDGTLLLTLEGDQIVTFSFNDVITNCTGNFSGSGVISSTDPYTLEIDFTGNDCDGNHTGKMVFTRLAR